MSFQSQFCDLSSLALKNSLRIYSHILNIIFSDSSQTSILRCLLLLLFSLALLSLLLSPLAAAVGKLLPSHRKGRLLRDVQQQEGREAWQGRDELLMRRRRVKERDAARGVVEAALVRGMHEEGEQQENETKSEGGSGVASARRQQQEVVRRQGSERRRAEREKRVDAILKDEHLYRYSFPGRFRKLEEMKRAGEKVEEDGEEEEEGEEGNGETRGEEPEGRHKVAGHMKEKKVEEERRSEAEEERRMEERRQRQKQREAKRRKEAEDAKGRAAQAAIKRLSAPSLLASEEGEESQRSEELARNEREKQQREEELKQVGKKVALLYRELESATAALLAAKEKLWRAEQQQGLGSMSDQAQLAELEDEIQSAQAEAAALTHGVKAASAALKEARDQMKALRDLMK